MSGYGCEQHPAIESLLGMYGEHHAGRGEAGCGDLPRQNSPRPRATSALASLSGDARSGEVLRRACFTDAWPPRWLEFIRSFSRLTDHSACASHGDPRWSWSNQASPAICGPAQAETLADQSPLKSGIAPTAEINGSSFHLAKAASRNSDVFFLAIDSAHVHHPEWTGLSQRWRTS